MAEIIPLIGIAHVLLPACNVVKRMAATHGRIKSGEKRCKDVIVRAGCLIKDVSSTLPPGGDQTSLEPIVAKFTTKLEQVQTIMQRLADKSLFKALIYSDDINREIEEANHHITDCLQLFQIELQVSWHAQADSERKAAKSDRDDLLRLLKKISGNYEEVRRCLGLHSDAEEDEAMAVMERELRNARPVSEEDMPVEMRIIQKSLECIKTTTGRGAPKQNKWLITQHDLDHCSTIGRGGFSTVSKAQFRGTMVAVKTLKDAENVKEALEGEIEIWSRLRHDHIVPFYGASTLTMPPFIVSRYMQNGNLVQYLARKPNVDRTKLVFEISLGMYYLHEEHVVHGDLKGVNVLVDDSGKACITDFGLSKVNSPATAGAKASRISGTLRFLAPEALKGQPLNFETDVYAFGMVIYEVFTGEVPFIREPDDSVEAGCLELQRPTSDKVRKRGLEDTLWGLLSDCISREPSARPRFKTIQARLRVHSTVIVHPEPTPDAEGDHDLDAESMAFTSHTLFTTSTAPLLEEYKKVSTAQRGISSSRSISRDINSVPPMCIQMTRKYFDVTFGCSSREPGAYLEENGTSQWQPIKPKKGSLLNEEERRFTYRSRICEGNNSWELDGSDVTLRNATVDPGVCHFRDASIARRWFFLQLSYARNGATGDWGTIEATGDWFETRRTWMRVVRGKLQQAGPVEGAPSLVPSNKAWSDVKSPKRCTIDDRVTTQNCIVCIVNAGKQPSKLCYRLEGHSIILETYRQQSDKRPIMTREETYSSQEDAEVAFDVLKAVLRPPRK